MGQQAIQKLIKIVSSASQPIKKSKDDYVSLLEDIGNARIVLIGEATHGTQEFYQTRIEITKRLIAEKNFMAVAIEGDWPDAYSIHRYVLGAGPITDYEIALRAFSRFPSWMWCNVTLPPFLKWLRSYNDNLTSSREKIGFFGLDLYSLNASMQAVIDYLHKVDPQSVQRALSRYACFDHMKPDPQTYGYLSSSGIKKSCLREAIDQLLEMQHHAFDYVRQDDLATEDEYLSATQNARVVKNAERYYRSMFEGHVQSWNIRDEHMVETLTILANALENRFGEPAKIVIWAHNSHVGDARATEMGSQGEVNMGQLIKEQYDTDAYSIGFSTFQGTVTAASDWDRPAECKKLVPGIEGSYEDLFNHCEHENFLLKLQNNAQLEHYLSLPRLQRAIGVIYRPETERTSHYFFSRLCYQFNSIIHFDHTTAVQPLEINPEWHEEPELTEKN